MIHRQAISMDLHSVLQDKIEQGMTDDQIIHAINNIDEITKQRDQLLIACSAAFTQLQRFGDATNTDQVQSHFDHDTIDAADLCRFAITQAERGAK